MNFFREISIIFKGKKALTGEESCATLTVLERLVQFVWEVRNVHAVFTRLRCGCTGGHPSRGSHYEQEVTG